MNFGKLMGWLAGLLLATPALAQDDARLPRSEVFLDGALSVKRNQQIGALSVVHRIGIGPQRRLGVGYGLRLTGIFGQHVALQTAPATLTTNATHPGVIFLPTLEGNLDTLHLDNTQVFALNLMVDLSYRVTDKWEVGFNIDAAGFSFGPTQNGRFQTSLPASVNRSPQAKPTPGNLLLVSDNDLGSLNSELYVRYRLSPRWAVRGGASFVFTEYTTTERLTFDNDRFRQKSLLATAGVTFYPWK